MTDWKKVHDGAGFCVTTRLRSVYNWRTVVFAGVHLPAPGPDFFLWIADSRKMRAVTWTLHMDKKLGYILDPVQLRHSAVMKAGPNILRTIEALEQKYVNLSS